MVGDWNPSPSPFLEWASPSLLGFPVHAARKVYGSHVGRPILVGLSSGGIARIVRLGDTIPPLPCAPRWSGAAPPKRRRRASAAPAMEKHRLYFLRKAPLTPSSYTVSRSVVAEREAQPVSPLGSSSVWRSPMRRGDTGGIPGDGFHQIPILSVREHLMGVKETLAIPLLDKV